VAHYFCNGSPLFIKTMQYRLFSLLLIFISTLSVSAKSITVDIKKYGAVADGKTLNTLAIQKAIDVVSNNKDGGQVIIGPGKWLTGRIELKSNVDLHLEDGAILLGSTNPYDYDENKEVGKRGDEDVHQGLIISNNAKNIAITGKGTIDGQGLALALAIDSLHHTGERLDPNYNTRRQRPSTRPKLLFLADTENIAISGVEFRNSAGWGLSFHGSTNIGIDNINVYNRAYWNNDGIDLNDCSNVHVRDCDINSADDGICLKSDDPLSMCKDISIERCRITSSASAVKFGTASYGGFRNISIRDIYVYDTFRSAIALETVDGAILENIMVDGVNAVNTGNPLFIRLGARHNEGKGICRNITIRNLKAQVPFGRPDEAYDLRGPEVDYFHNPWPSSITGLPGSYVENISLENIDIEYPGRATKGMAYVGTYRAQDVPEKADSYPEFSMFGELPSWAFYLRHVKGLRMSNVNVRLADSDFRPAIVLEDVVGLKIEDSNIPESQILKVEKNQSVKEKIAFISDAHVQDVVGHPELVRSQEAQVQSTRLFNENYFAICAALDDCGKRGIKTVVLPGDLTDNGQPINQACVRDILNRYAEKYGMHYFVCFGNHDPARPFGFDFINKDYLASDGSQYTMSSRPLQDARYNPELRGSTVEEQVECYRLFGFFPQKDYDYWATPFSSYTFENYSFDKAETESAIQNRQYMLNDTLKAYDTSYVVEPIKDIWLLSIDGSVYQPKGMKDGEMVYNGSEMGYNDVLEGRSHLFGWIKKVSEEAKKQGKVLVTFCHYPILDYNDGAGEYIAKSWGPKCFDVHRTPLEAVTDSIMSAGVEVHFAGHMHVNDTGIKEKDGKRLVNVQIPSPGLFVPAYKILTIDGPTHLEVETIALDSVQGFDTLFPLYQKEYNYDIAHGKKPIWSIEALQSKTYTEFCDWHLKDLVRVRFIPRDLPKVLREKLIGKNGLEILRSISPKAKGTASMKDWTGFDLILDLYRLRYAGELAHRFIPDERLKEYDILFNAAKASTKDSEFINQMQSLGEMFKCFLNEENSGNFNIDSLPALP